MARRAPAGAVEVCLARFRIADEDVERLVEPPVRRQVDLVVEKRGQVAVLGGAEIELRHAAIRPPDPEEIAELPAYEGCRSWVELEKPLPTEGSTPVLNDESFRIVRKQLDLLLSPTAFA